MPEKKNVINISSFKMWVEILIGGCSNPTELEGVLKGLWHSQDS